MQKIMFNDRYGLTQAVLDGRKTVTRRSEHVSQWLEPWSELGYSRVEIKGMRKVWLRNDQSNSLIVEHTRYALGEVVAVAQSYKDAGINPDYIVSSNKDGTPVTAIQSPGWTNKMFIRADLMPHQIRITGIQCEQLQEISNKDCLREGIQPMLTGCEYYLFSFIDSSIGCFCDYKTPREAFAALINKVSGKGTWERNPFVVVYEFEIVK